MKLKKNQVKLFNRLIKFTKGDNGNQFLIEGEGGSGKTFTISYTLNKLLSKKFFEKTNLYIIAPTNAAKKVILKTILKLLKQNPENHEKFKHYMYEDKTIKFNTIHSFFKSKQQFDENGNQFFEVQWEKSVMTESMKAQAKRKEEEPNFKVRTKHLIILDETSMLDPEKYEMFKKVLDKYPKSKIIFMGDRNQLPYVQTEQVDDDYLSPVFKEVTGDNYFRLKGNERSNNEGVTKVINRTKKCVIKKKFKFRMKKSDLSDNINLITDKELENNKKVKEFIKNEKPKMITYSNKRRDKLNNIARDQIYTDDHDYIDRYLFLENEELIFENSYFGDSPDPLYHNTDEVTVKDVKYNIIKEITFFGIFKKIFNVQKITLEDGISLFQISKTQIKAFERIIVVLKRCAKDYFSFNDKKPGFSGISTRCDCCGKTKTSFKKFYKEERICKDCYFKVREYIKKTFFCKFCKDLDNHKETGCGSRYKLSKRKVKEKVLNDLYKMINSLNDRFNLPVKYSYAITVYKSQGSTYKNVMIDFDNIYECNRGSVENLTRSFYVGTSRTQDKLWFLNYRHT